MVRTRVIIVVSVASKADTPTAFAVEIRWAVAGGFAPLNHRLWAMRPPASRSGGGVVHFYRLWRGFASCGLCRLLDSFGSVPGAALRSAPGCLLGALRAAKTH